MFSLELDDNGIADNLLGSVIAMLAPSFRDPGRCRHRARPRLDPDGRRDPTSPPGVRDVHDTHRREPEAKDCMNVERLRAISVGSAVTAIEGALTP